MTHTPPGASEAATTATLAVRLDALRREVKSLTNNVAALTSTQSGHTTALSALPELHTQVKQILTLLNEDNSETSPDAWFWLTMTKQEHDEKLAELHDWVTTVLHTQYPDYIRDHVKPCWPNHPEARWELSWLYRLWTLAYLKKRTAPRDAAEWHDRWFPGVIHRLAPVMNQCDQVCSKPSRTAPTLSSS